MIRHTLTVTFECAEALTDEQIVSARALIGQYEAEDGMPSGRVVNVTVTQETECPIGCYQCGNVKPKESATMPGAEGDNDGSVSNDGSTPQRAEVGGPAVAQVAAAGDASPARRRAGDAPTGGAPAEGHLLDELVTIGPDPDESRVTGYRIRGPWRATRQAAELDALLLNLETRCAESAATAAAGTS